MGVSARVPVRDVPTYFDGARAPEVKGFRPAPRRRARIAAGAMLVAMAVGGNVLVYSSLDDRVSVLQLVADVRAGEVLAADDLRVVEVHLDPTVPTVAAADVSAVAGQHARVHLVAGTLLSPVLLQTAPLVAPGVAVVAIELRPTLVPDGVRERSRIQVIAVTDGVSLGAEGRVVTRPLEADGVSGVVTMSVEVPAVDAARIAAADDVRVVLLDPGADPAYDTEGE